MKGIKSIIYETDGQSLVINIGDKCQIIYNDILNIISEEKIFEYLRNLFSIIDSWDKEYINIKMIDGNCWNLYIINFNGTKKQYCGKSNYPNNFEAFQRLNQKLIAEVLNG